MPLDYNTTVNLPSTEFPMRAGLPQREPEFLKTWTENKLYHKLIEKNSDKPLYILHDGPPYANGDIHIGHTLNKILKDIVVRYKNMSGFKAPFIPGWDTHGLPIEQQAIKKLGINRHEVGAIKFREACRDFALGYVNKQREQFKRLGCIADWDNAYMTLMPKFEGKQIQVFGDMAKKGYIYKGMKPVYWCPDCETALAEAEIEYSDDPCDSIYVKFRVKNDNGLLSKVCCGLDNVYFVIWTTTTWTLPGNLAICLNADFEYSIVKANGECYIIASELVDSVVKAAKIDSYEIVGKLKGSDFELMTAQHPFIDRESLVIVGDHVTLEAGTGCVHTAPGHGVEDFIVCKNYPQIGVVVPVDNKGIMTSEAGKFEGLPYYKANAAIAEELKSTNSLFAIERIEHTYPHCWRCKNPIVFRATEQWFASINGFKEAAIKAAQGVEWVPDWGRDRIVKMIEDRSDWCISRQRIWGVPIPIFYCDKCGKELINDDTIKAVSDLFTKEGSDAWYKYEASQILPAGTKCACGHEKFHKETDIMDVWFDSGSSHIAVLETWEGQRWPADMYLEGNDQYRGWFQSSLLTSVASRGVAPYKTVLTHGFCVDGEGKKMSKSLGNGIDPLDVIKEYGADILRLWVISSDYKVDIRFSKEILKQLSESYRKIRNTARFILGNLTNFDPDSDMVAYEDMLEIDRWVLMRLNSVIERIINAYETYEYHTIFHTLHSFCVVDLSNFYLDIIKDRLYIEKAGSIKRRSAQTAMYKILDAITRLLAPSLAFTAEEIWQFMPHIKQHDRESVMFNPMPKVEPLYNNAVLDEKWSKILSLREDVKKALEIARAQKTIGSSLEAKVILYCEPSAYEYFSKMADELPSIFIVSGVEIKNENKPQGVCPGEAFPSIAAVILPADGEKCERCWVYSESVGSNKEHPTLCARCAEIVSN